LVHKEQTQEKQETVCNEVLTP